MKVNNIHSIAIQCGNTMSDTTLKATFGLLILLVVSTGIYVSLQGDATMGVFPDRTVFLVNISGEMLLGGSEYLFLFSGNSRVSSINSQIEIFHEFDNESNILTVTRRTPFVNGAVIENTYVFDSLEGDITKFPLEHRVRVLNGSGLFFRYEVRDLVYDGPTDRNLNVTEMSFGRNMKVEWQEGYRWAHVFSSGVLRVQYAVTSNDETFLVRLFDPPFAGGTGISTNPYQISTCQQLQNMEQELDSYFILINDIDCSPSYGWSYFDGFGTSFGFKPIDDFEGVLDGQGYVIRDLFIDVQDIIPAGIVGDTFYAFTIENTGLVDANISTEGYAGGFAGSAFGGGAVLSQVFITGFVYGGMGAGGLAGWFAGSVTDSYSLAAVSGDIIGGLFSTYYGGSGVVNSYAAGQLSGDIVGGISVGGDDTHSSVYWDVEATGVSTSEFGIGLNTSEMTFPARDAYEDWSFFSTWDIHPAINNGYPHLLWQSPERVDGYFNGGYLFDNTVYSVQLENVLNWSFFMHFNLSAWPVDENVYFLTVYDTDTGELVERYYGLNMSGQEGIWFCSTFSCFSANGGLLVGEFQQFVFFNGRSARNYQSGSAKHNFFPTGVSSLRNLTFYVGSRGGTNFVNDAVFDEIKVYDENFYYETDKLLSILYNEGGLSEDPTLTVPLWEPYTAYSVGDKVLYESEGYEVIFAHTSSPIGTPPVATNFYEPYNVGTLLYYDSMDSSFVRFPAESIDSTIGCMAPDIGGLGNPSFGPGKFGRGLIFDGNKDSFEINRSDNWVREAIDGFPVPEEEIVPVTDWASDGVYSMFLQGGGTLIPTFFYSKEINTSLNKIVFDINVTQAGSLTGDIWFRIDGTEVWSSDFTPGVYYDVEIDTSEFGEINKIDFKASGGSFGWATAYVDNIRYHSDGAGQFILQETWREEGEPWNYTLAMWVNSSLFDDNPFLGIKSSQFNMSVRYKDSLSFGETWYGVWDTTSGVQNNIPFGIDEFVLLYFYFQPELHEAAGQEFRRIQYWNGTMGVIDNIPVTLVPDWPEPFTFYLGYNHSSFDYFDGGIDEFFIIEGFVEYNDLLQHRSTRTPLAPEIEERILVHQNFEPNMQFRVQDLNQQGVQPFTQTEFCGSYVVPLGLGTRVFAALDSPLPTGLDLQCSRADDGFVSLNHILLPDDSLLDVYWKEYPSGFFVGGGDSGDKTRFIWSENGKDWFESEVSSNFEVRGGLAWSEELGIFVAVGGGGSVGPTVFYTSEDGKNFSEAEYLFTNTDLTKVVWSPELELFVAIGGVSDTPGENAAWSEDGFNWTLTSAPSSMTDVAWSPELGIFSAVGYSGKNMWSTDGKNWNQESDLASSLYAVAWSPELSRFAATGFGGFSVWSEDGANWTTGQDTSGNYFGLSWSSELGLFVGVGQNGLSVWSEDGQNWNSLNPFGSAFLRAIYWSPDLEMFSALGFQGARFSSSDGINWDNNSVVNNHNIFALTHRSMPKKLLLNNLGTSPIVFGSPEYNQIFCQLNLDNPSSGAIGEIYFARYGGLYGDPGQGPFG